MAAVYSTTKRVAQDDTTQILVHKVGMRVAAEAITSPIPYSITTHSWPDLKAARVGGRGDMGNGRSAARVCKEGVYVYANELPLDSYDVLMGHDHRDLL